jgi:hypothetical protein
MFNPFSRKKQEERKPSVKEEKEKRLIRRTTYAIKALKRKKRMKVLAYLYLKQAGETHLKTPDGRRRFRKIRKKAMKRIEAKGFGKYAEADYPDIIANEIYEIALHYFSNCRIQVKKDIIVAELESDLEKYIR